VIGGWLPKTMYVTRFEESGFRPFSTYENDIDPTTGSVPGVTIRGDSLAVWHEAVLPFRTANTSQNNSVAVIGWNRRIAGADLSRLGAPASYTITLPDTLAQSWSMGRDGSIAFLLTATLGAPAPRPAPREMARKDTTAALVPAPAPRPPTAPTVPDTTLFDLTVELIDAQGTVARLPLSLFGAIRRPLEARIFRREQRELAQFTRRSEIVLQSYILPFADFTAANPSFDPTSFRAIRFVFDRTVAGAVMLDDVGFSPLGPVISAASASSRGP
jgi:hypothetical protein